jgi:hypothetical protein
MIGSHLFWLSRSKGITVGLGIIILQGVSSRKSLAGVNLMELKPCQGGAVETVVYRKPYLYTNEKIFCTPGRTPILVFPQPCRWLMLHVTELNDHYCYYFQVESVEPIWINFTPVYHPTITSFSKKTGFSCPNYNSANKLKLGLSNGFSALL